MRPGRCPAVAGWPVPAGPPVRPGFDALERLAAEQTSTCWSSAAASPGPGWPSTPPRGASEPPWSRRHDFASGTSSKSSKMVHGGHPLPPAARLPPRLREPRRAPAAARERPAPGLAAAVPDPPVRRRDGVVNRRWRARTPSALWLYDLTGGVRIGRRHRRIEPGRGPGAPPHAAHRPAGGRLPLLRRPGRRRPADAGRGAHRRARPRRRGGQLRRRWSSSHRRRWPVSAEPSGAPRSAAEPLRGPGHDAWSTPPASGPTRCAPSTSGAAPIRIRPAKGIHVTVPGEPFPADIAAVIPVREGPAVDLRRPVARGRQVYLGTTDTDWDGPLDDPACPPEDVDYVLDAANAVTTTKLTRADVTGVWAGLRPLLAPVAGAPRERADRRPLAAPHGPDLAARAGHGDRGQAHHLPQDGRGHRRRVVELLGAGPRRTVTQHLRLRVPPPKARASTRRRPGRPSRSPGRTVHEAGRHETAPSLRSHLWARYGTEATDVLRLAEGRPELLQPLVHGLPYLGAEVLYAVRDEMAQTVDDVLARRTRALIRTPPAPPTPLPGSRASWPPCWVGIPRGLRRPPGSSPSPRGGTSSGPPPGTPPTATVRRPRRQLGLGPAPSQPRSLPAVGRAPR